MLPYDAEWDLHLHALEQRLEAKAMEEERARAEAKAAAQRRGQGAMW